MQGRTSHTPTPTEGVSMPGVKLGFSLMRSSTAAATAAALPW